MTNQYFEGCTSFCFLNHGSENVFVFGSIIFKSFLVHKVAVEYAYAFGINRQHVKRASVYDMNSIHKMYM